MEPRFETRAAFTVAGVKCRTTMADNQIPALWDDFGRRMAEIPNPAPDRKCYGVCYYEPGDGPPNNEFFSYLAGFAVTSDGQLPAGMERYDIPAASYAVFEHLGTLDTLNQTYTHIYSEWLPQSGYVMAGNHDFEVYDQRFKHGQPDSVMEIWIPVTKP